MGFVAAILATLSLICAAISTVTILQPLGPFLSDKFTWVFWMYLAIFFILGTIATLLIQRRNNTVD